LKIQKDESERAEAEKAAEAQKKFEDHEQVISAHPIDFATNNLVYWWPEDDQFWKRWGCKICGPNLIWSSLNLFLMFAVFIHWIVVRDAIAAAHVGSLYKVYDFGIHEATGKAADVRDYVVTANLVTPLAAFSGATQRGVQCWMTSIVGGRIHNVVNTFFLCVPLVLASIFLSLSDCPFWAVWLVSVLSGIAGGAFASSVNNISNFFPKRMQGLALGVVAGLGNVGEAFAYGVMPLVVDVGICAAGASGQCDAKDFGGKYPFNAGIFLAVLLIVIGIPSWLKLNNAPGHGSEKGARRSIVQYFQLSSVGWLWGLIIGFLWWLTEFSMYDDKLSDGRLGQTQKGSLILQLLRVIGFSIVAFVLVQGSLYYFTPVDLKTKLRNQMGMIRTKDIWLMSLLYSALFGSLMAWCVVFWVVIDYVFAPGMAFQNLTDLSYKPLDKWDYAWIGPFTGGLFRILGGYLADKYGGATITLWSLILLIISTGVAAMMIIIAVAQIVDLADPTPEFVPYILGCVGIFASAGMGSGSVYRQIGFLYPPETRGPALGFVSCIASFAAAVIIILGVQSILSHVLDDNNAHIGVFATVVVLYIPITVVNWWFYKRAKAVNQC
jgi:NNP family nitrate/nitrite transporter-like MFS transporter